MSDTGSPARVRVDAWLWAVRCYPTRSAATAACRAGHVRIDSTAVKASHPVGVGTLVQVRRAGFDSIYEVVRPIVKRTSAAIAAECRVDRTPPRPEAERLVAAPRRDRGAGRPTKRERREIDRLRGRDASSDIDD